MPGGLAYRPLSQGLFFLALRALDPASGLLGHLLTLTLFVVSTWLLASLVSRVAGRRAGFVAGMAFAALGCSAGLVAWVSGCQDLLAITLALTALRLRHEGRNAAAVAATACALLAKETAGAFLPALVLWDWLVGRSPHRIARAAATYGVLAGAWGLIHPGARALLAGGGAGGATGAVGLVPPGLGAAHLLGYLATVFNLPVTGLATPWRSDLMLWGIAALAPVAAWLWMERASGTRRGGSPPPLPRGRALALGGLLLLPPLLPPALLLRHWTPYYAGMAGAGAGTLLGALLARARPRWIAAVLVLDVALGLWCRGLVVPSEAVWSEPVFLEASRAARTVERNFKTLRPGLPRGAHALVSVTGSGFRGIHATLLEAQALRVWYADPGIETLPPERRRGTAPAELLFRVTANLDVVELDPDRLEAKWSGGGTPHPWEISRPIRAYARGVAATGNPDRAVAILSRLAAIERGEERAYDARLAGMVLLAEGRDAEARGFLDGAAAFPRDTALEIVKKLLSEPVARARIDSCAFPAFGLDAADPEVARYLMRRFRDEGLKAQAVHFARRLDGSAPGDVEGAETIRRFASPAGRGR